MSSRIADIPVPPECGTMIRAGALVAVNHSGGKDSQAMTILLSRIAPPRPARGGSRPARRGRVARHRGIHSGDAPAQYATDPRTRRVRQVPA